MTDNKSKKVFRIGETSLLCLNGCGFYGNPEWRGYCSVCFKQIYAQSQQINSTASMSSLLSSPVKMISSGHRRNQSLIDGYSNSRHSPLPVPLSKSLASSSTTLSQTSACTSNASSSYPTFEKFEEKKRHQTEKRSKTLRSIFKRASTFREKSVATVSPFTSPSFVNNSSLVNSSLPLSASRALTSLKDQKLFSFDTLSLAGEEVVSTLLREAELHDIKRQVTKAIEKLDKLIISMATIEELSEYVHEFYQIMSDRFETHTLYSGSTQEQIDYFNDLIEKHLLSQLYHTIFSRIQNEDEDKDLELQKRIKSLNWIQIKHLDIEINLKCSNVNDLLDKAISEIIEMGSKLIPLEKLDCIVDCSKTIFDLLKQNRTEPVSADQFLPALVYVVIQANPPLLHSNIKFITRFSNPRRLMSGEAGYYFTNLCCSVAFIEKLNGDSLNIPEEEFQRYISGEILPPGSIEQSKYLAEPLRIVYSNVNQIKNLNEQQDQLENNIKELREKMVSSRNQMMKNIDQMIKPFQRPFYTFDLNLDMNLVPSFLRQRLEFEKAERSKKEELLIDIESDKSLNERSATDDDISKECGCGDNDIGGGGGDSNDVEFLNNLVKSENSDKIYLENINSGDICCNKSSNLNYGNIMNNDNKHNQLSSSQTVLSMDDDNLLVQLPEPLKPEVIH